MYFPNGGRRLAKNNRVFPSRFEPNSINPIKCSHIIKSVVPQSFLRIPELPGSNPNFDMDVCQIFSVENTPVLITSSVIKSSQKAQFFRFKYITTFLLTLYSVNKSLNQTSYIFFLSKEATKLTLLTL